MLLILLLCFISQAWGLCYTPDQSISNDLPCNPSDIASVCCQTGFLCMSNGLCQPPWWTSSSTNVSSQFIRGTCTDKEWKASQCRGFCVKENPSGGEYVYACGDKTSNTSEWCCFTDTCCGNSASEKFQIGAASVTATAGATSSTSSASSSATSASSTAGSSTTSSPASTSTAAEPAAASSNSSLAVGLGAGLGGGLGVIAIAAGVFYFLRRRKQPSGPIAYTAELDSQAGGFNPATGYKDPHVWPISQHYPPPNSYSDHTPVYEVSNEGRSELSNETMHQQRFELPSSTHRQEGGL